VSLDPKKKLSPDVGGRHGIVNQVHASLPDEVVKVYSEYPDCCISLNRLSQGIGGLLQPLADFGPGPWSALQEGFKDAYFVDKRFEDTENDAGHLYVVVPVAVGFVSVRLKRGMHGDVYEKNDGGKTLRNATAHLPTFLRSTMRLAAVIGINHSSAYLEIPDVRWFYGRGDGVGAHLTDNIRGATRKKAALKFGERWEWDLHLLASDDEHTWFVFADLGERSEGALWVALREDFKDVRRLINPQVAYESMLVHYLGGARTSFDFKPYAEPQSIW
jgi:hypothetical protein